MGSPLDPSSLAQQVLAEHWHRDLPINPVEIANSLGVKVVRGDLGEDVAGAVYRDGPDIVIAISAKDPPVRQRFTCAHELGHLCKRIAENKHDIEFVDKRNFMSSLGQNPEEVFANQFAASLLMPEHQVRYWRSLSSNVTWLAKKFDVSGAAMEIRISNLGL